MQNEVNRIIMTRFSTRLTAYSAHFWVLLAIATIVMSAALVTQARAEMHDKFERLDRSKPIVEAFIGYAASVGIVEADITAAIFDGHFVPHPDDINAVKEALDPRSCDEIKAAWKIDGFNCLREKHRPKTPGDAEWNRRFGPPSDDRVFHLTQRIAYQLRLSQGDWQSPLLTLETVTSLPPDVRIAMEQVRKYALPSYIQLRNVNDPTGPTDFAGAFEANRSKFVARRIAESKAKTVAALAAEKQAKMQRETQIREAKIRAPCRVTMAEFGLVAMCGRSK